MQDEVRKKFKCRWNIFVQNFDIEADVFLASECIQVPADGVHLARKLTRVARCRSLEDHVLDEVGDAVQLQWLVARAGGDPHAHGDRADVGDALGEYEQAIGEECPADVAGGGFSDGGWGEDCGHAAPCSFIVSQWVGCCVGAHG